MTLAGRNVLLVGQNFHSAQSLTERLRRREFQCHFAINVRAARERLASHPIDLVLSKIHLLEGTGYGLLMNLVHRPVSAFLCVSVENSCLWLPAIDGGKDCLGLPALRPSEFARSLDEMALRLSSCSCAL
jgi:response regulator RpfG family c-di-GMP phosphodiesterase